MPSNTPRTIDSGITTNPRFSEKVKKFFAEYTWIGIIIFILTTYVAFVWQINTMIVARVEKEAELGAKIGVLEGKIDVLLQQKGKSKD